MHSNQYNAQNINGNSNNVNSNMINQRTLSTENKTNNNLYQQQQSPLIVNNTNNILASKLMPNNNINGTSIPNNMNRNNYNQQFTPLKPQAQQFNLQQQVPNQFQSYNNNQSKRELLYPVGSVEATQPIENKRKKIESKNIGKLFFILIFYFRF